MQQPIGRIVRLPAVQSFRPKSTFVHGIDCAPAYTDDAPILYCDIERAAVGAEHASRLDPSIRLCRDPTVDPLRPLITASKRSARSPKVLDAVAAFHRASSRDTRLRLTPLFQPGSQTSCGRASQSD